MTTTQRRYELIYIATPDAGEEQLTGLHAEVEGIVARFGGAIEATEQWGRRKMAYEIRRHREGQYVMEVIAGSGDLMKELDRRLKVTDAVLRHLIVRVDDEHRVADRARTQRSARVERRRAVRAAKAPAAVDRPAVVPPADESEKE